MKSTKKNYKIFIVPIIAVVLFTLLIFGAGFAYFSARITTNNITNISATLPPAGTTITTTSTSCDMNVTAEDMLESSVSGTAKKTSSCFLNVTLNGASGVSCTYDVVLVQNPGSRLTTQVINGNQIVVSSVAMYSPTSGISSFEFTGQLGRDDGNGGFLNSLPSGATVKNSSTTETQINTLTGNGSCIKDGVEISAANSMMCLMNGGSWLGGWLAHGTISIPESQSSNTVSYKFQEKWYNLDVDQSTHSWATYQFALKVTNVMC